MPASATTKTRTARPTDVARTPARAQPWTAEEAVDLERRERQHARGCRHEAERTLRLEHDRAFHLPGVEAVPQDRRRQQAAGDVPRRAGSRLTARATACPRVMPRSPARLPRSRQPPPPGGTAAGAPTTCGAACTKNSPAPMSAHAVVNGTRPRLIAGRPSKKPTKNTIAPGSTYDGLTTCVEKLSVQGQRQQRAGDEPARDVGQAPRQIPREQHQRRE